MNNYMAIRQVNYVNHSRVDKCAFKHAPQKHSFRASRNSSGDAADGNEDFASKIVSETILRTRTTDKLDQRKPKRPLSAYNLFFQHERLVLLDSLPVRPQGKPRHSHVKVGFVEMARIIGQKWKCIDESTKSFYDALALQEKQRYQRELAAYKQIKKSKKLCLSDNVAPLTTTQPEPTPSILSVPTVNYKQSRELLFSVEPLVYSGETSECCPQLDQEMVDILIKAVLPSPSVGYRAST